MIGVDLKNQKGSAVAYLLLALFLSGVLMATMMEETSVATTNIKLQDVKNKLASDLATISAGINECILLYPDAVDVDGDGDIDSEDNPNPPYPIYNDDSTGVSGDVIADIKCPGSGETIFTPAKGRFFKLLGDTTKYTTTYYNAPGQNVEVSIDYTIDSSVWDEALAQIDASYPAEMISVDTATGTCATGSCLAYVLKASCDLTSLAVGEVCGGLVYAGSYSGNRLYTTLFDQGRVAWSAAYTTTGANSSSDGAANTATISAFTDTAYYAVDLCTALGSEWYLPSSGELAVLDGNRKVGSLNGTFNDEQPGSTSVYWSSTEDSGNSNVVTISHMVNSPSYGNWSKLTTHNVRCVRTD